MTRRLTTDLQYFLNGEEPFAAEIFFIMKVKARKGIRVPREDNARRYIEQEPVEVPESTYYLRRV